MTAPRDPARMVEGAAQWANASIEAWASNARAMAGGLDAGSYSASDWFSGAVNVGSAACRVGYEWLEYVMTGRVPERVQSDDFSITRRSPGTRVLELVGALQGLLPPIQTIERARVTIVPAQLAGSATSFRLDVDATGCRGGLYRGAVRVLAGQAVEETVTVVVQVP